MKIAVVDCSKPMEERKPVLRDATPIEQKELEDFFAVMEEDRKKPKPKTDKERIDELEAKLDAMAKK